jgi:hypothetical protein
MGELGEKEKEVNMEKMLLLIHRELTVKMEVSIYIIKK